VISKTLKCQAITRANPVLFPLRTIVGCNENLIDELFFIVIGISPSARVRDLACGTHLDFVLMAAREAKRLIDAEPTRLETLSHDLSNTASVALALGLAPELIHPDRKPPPALRRSNAFLEEAPVALVGTRDMDVEPVNPPAPPVAVSPEPLATHGVPDGTASTSEPSPDDRSKRRRLTRKSPASPYNPVLTEAETRQLAFSAENYLEENKALIDWFFSETDAQAASSAIDVIDLSGSESSD